MVEPEFQASGSDVDPDAPASVSRSKLAVLLGSILLIAMCGITYELIVATISSYVQGNSVFEFSLTIGLFMSSMGLGSWLSRYFQKRLLNRYLQVEILIAVIGGITSPLLFTVFAFSDQFRLAQIGVSIAIGTLVGLEIPLLTRFLRQYTELRVAIAQVLSWDYIGALVGSIAFPVILLPKLGLIGASLLVGLINLAVAAAGVIAFRDELKPWRSYLVGCAMVAIGLVGMFVGAGGIERYIDGQLYRDQIIYSEQTPYQKIVVTRWQDDIRLYINGNIQFSSVDEYRYHEALTHIPMAMVADRSRVLVLGGGDGMVVREIRRWEGVQEIALVDLDPAMTRISSELEPIVALNEDALNDERLTIYNDDAMNWLETNQDKWDVIVIDLPDPNHEALAKLYSRAFYRLVRGRLKEGGVAVTQSTSPYFSPRAFWCIHKTMETAFCPESEAQGGTGCDTDGHVLAYHANVPNFGDWGFNVASTEVLPDPESLDIPVPTRYLHPDLLPALFVFPGDQQEMPVDVNRLIDPVLLYYYLDDWSRWNI